MRGASRQRITSDIREAFKLRRKFTPIVRDELVRRAIRIEFAKRKESKKLTTLNRYNFRDALCVPQQPSLGLHPSELFIRLVPLEERS